MSQPAGASITIYYGRPSICIEITTWGRQKVLLSRNNKLAGPLPAKTLDASGR